uniref:PDEase domain-containing protein n=1 Tax=Chromera velia CCMP2878 TaxID=1169474 RepID=A0A0G4F1I5_9ALVE|eukprot:Cvel_14655.t1-p1 / transcript=Cvel_14655.t1 / gene=Cvel_14655 / organism=Chromera_velia_CCMP2878 / gene_product=Probable 3',5'-cyclic phosphodiesterase pde-1, putative / transcript_product=Probable 3',5'-cyclic phosphodiesterase pde-1, putative / location=Cvel_scaffold1050:20086-28298(+) / protein_length=385 / sequence_SO=supercontig / SO=protein_coding / is_pseudo=false
MTVWLAEHCGVRRLLSSIQNVSVVIVALCYDLGHQGFNNQFHLNSGSEIAMMYNDRSVLENFHAAKTFLALKTKGCKMLEHRGTEDQQLARSAIIDLILDTDMKRVGRSHFEFVSSLKLLLTSPGFASNMSPSGSLVREVERKEEDQKGKQAAEDHIWMVTRACLKAADLGYSAKPWRIHFARAVCVTSEFFHQGDTERSMGLPISPLCNRRETTPSGLCKSQLEIYLDRKGKLADPIAIAALKLRVVADKVDNLSWSSSWWYRDDLVEAAPKNASLATEVFQAANVAGVCEQGFSLYDQVYSGKKNRLTQPHQDLLVTTHANLHFQRVHQRNAGHHRRETQILGIQGLDLASDESAEAFDDELDGEIAVEYLKNIGLEFREAAF